MFFRSLIFVACLSTAVFGQTFYGSTDLQTFRDGRDKEFRDRTQSPLLDEDFGKFTGLSYYPVNKAFRVKARFTKTAAEKYFQMPTSSGITKKFAKYGVLNFTLFGCPQRVTVYIIDPATRAKFPEYADLLFVPFRDLTSGKETYGAGRYIDIKAPTGREVILDFNLAYNPNCAYGATKYSCPIPPKENHLRLTIAAGEKKYAYSHIKGEEAVKE